MRLLAPALLIAALAAGCAPSLRMVHQSNAYFEECHGADFDPAVTPELRHQCWARWLQHYTYGQPPDRVEYARGRVAALEDGEEIEPLPGLRQAAMDGSYTASFLTTVPAQQAQQAEHAQDPGETSEEEPTGDEAAQATSAEATAETTEATDVADGDAEPAPDATRTAVWERPARRVIEPQRELPAPPDTQGACARVCTPRWNVCMSRCDDRPESCREACETEHRTCMRGCF